ncbi:MAG: acyl carrier protein [Planctomycetes bacterium]|nr:acyl carrier protein [Planctomycetota bacterium]
MEPTEIIRRLRQIMARTATTQHDWNRVSADDAIAALGIDSLAMLDFVYDIQQEFGIQFEPAELVSVTTVGQLATFIAARAPA